MKKLFTITLCLLLTLVLASCGTKPGKTENVDSNKFNVNTGNKTRINIANFGGGIGREWLDEAMERFAELKQDASYAEGKKGVYLEIVENSFNLNTLGMKESDVQIYFDERNSDVSALAQSELLLNLNSIVKDENREGGSLEEAIFDSIKGILTGNDGNYYGLPHYEIFGGLSYDRKEFEKYNAFFADPEDDDAIEYESTKYGSAYMIYDANTTKSVGPDGIKGTEDDGLPRSYEEFIILMDYLKNDKGRNPLVVSGQYRRYCDYLLCGLWANIAGSEQMKNYYNCKGEIEVVDRNSDGSVKVSDENLFVGIDYIKKPVTKKIVLNGENGYLSNDIAAKYYAIALLEVMVKEGFFSSNSTINTRSHYDAQLDLYMGKVGAGSGVKACMLVEGSYWYNESAEAGCFNTYEMVTGNKREDLDIRWMALPTTVYTEDFVGREQTLLDIGLSYCMVNGNIKDNDELRQACLDFVAFLYSEKELQNFTIKTGIERMVNYNLSNETVSGMSKYYASVWNMRDKTGSNIVAYSGETNAFIRNKSQLKVCLDSNCFLYNGAKIMPSMEGGSTTKDIFEKTRIVESSWIKTND